MRTNLDAMYVTTNDYILRFNLIPKHYILYTRLIYTKTLKYTISNIYTYIYIFIYVKGTQLIVFLFFVFIFFIEFHLVEYA